MTRSPPTSRSDGARFRQRYLDGERLADFFRIYMDNLNILYDNYRDLWRQIIPIVESLPEVRRYFQFAAADTGMMTG